MATDLPERARTRRKGAGGQRRSKPRSAAELLPAALRSLGIPSARLTSRLRKAWGAACEEAWRGRTLLRRLEGGVLEIGVASAALRDELTNFHRDRLLAVLRVALPDVPLVAIRFVSDPADGDGV